MRGSDRSTWLRRRLLISVGSLIGLSACKQKSIAPVVDLLIETDGDLLAFKPAELSCLSGAHVRLIFRHTGKYISSDHNWVLILPHTFDDVTKAALASGEKNGWIPVNDKRILAATPLCGRGQQVSVEFVSPAPGDYPFICSNPGHAESMWGILHVTET